MNLQCTAGFAHTLILSWHLGKPYLQTCGYNSFGQHGLMHKQSTDTLQKVPLPEGFTPYQVIAGGHHTLVLGVENNTPALYAFGSNSYGQLGLGPKKDQDEFVRITNPIHPVLTKQNTLIALKEYAFTKESCPSNYSYYGLGFFLGETSKKEELAAINALTSYIKNGIPIDKIHEPALKKGKLEQIVKERTIQLKFSDKSSYQKIQLL